MGLCEQDAEGPRDLGSRVGGQLALDLPTTQQLLYRLSTDRGLRHIVAWARLDEVRDEATFSRAFAEFAQKRAWGNGRMRP